MKAMFDVAMPDVGTKAKCDRCGKTVWLRRAGTVAFSERWPKGTRCFQWCARKGTKPRPIYCPVSDGWPTTYHEVDGRRVYHLPGEQ